MHFIDLAIAYNLCIIFVRNDKAARRWDYLVGKGLVDGKIEAVAEFQVVLPFVIGYKVTSAGFNFHDRKEARLIERDNIRASPVF